MPLPSAFPFACAPIIVDLPFDYRSQRFEDDAQALVRQAGAPLDDCRQALFMAEGDVDLARDLLERGYGALSADPPTH